MAWNRKVRCTKSINGRFIVGKIYSVTSDGKMKDENGDYGCACRTDSFKHWNKDCNWDAYAFEEVKEENESEQI
ncbi:hypothetical protein [Caproicibacterium amylolyticum]|uniref:Uncharacterized protein n=1 Tax=Caproicibacterium amylolyticum TaxID=2766537 RepID=A0A7G9WJU4_9FIRM|nr:hypothetical protein [Caproicibacterium amylolyticum]QNO18956.1 hypothetical protein H6X83_04845 [Caproicibacterium amylolyticum]